MKKYFKISSIILTILVLCTSIVSAYSASYLTLNGFSFLAEDDFAVIYDYDNRNSEVTIPRMLGSYYVSEIGEYAFMDNINITSISFSEARNLKKLNELSFAGCKNLTSVVIPTWLNEISFSTFQECTSLSSVIFYSNIKEIPEQAFYMCTSLEEINLPESLKSIGKFAFGDCSSLKTITIPKGVNSIGKNAFSNCSKLTIHCYENSYAHTYAVDNNIPFELISDPAYDLGDVDLSGVIDIKDSTSIQKHLAEIEMLDDTQLSVADFNQDGGINIIDATAIQKYLVS